MLLIQYQHCGFKILSCVCFSLKMSTFPVLSQPYIAIFTLCRFTKGVCCQLSEAVAGPSLQHLTLSAASSKTFVLNHHVV